jgi:hypothetical protein
LYAASCKSQQADSLLLKLPCESQHAGVLLLKLLFGSQHAAALLSEGAGLIMQLHGMLEAGHMNTDGMYALCSSAPGRAGSSAADRLRELIAGQIQVHQVRQATKCCADRS